VTGLGPLRTRLQRAVGRGLTKFVGREREMEAFKHAAEQAKSGRGQIVAAMAEPGVGKSRLYFEFKATSQSGWMVLETFSVSHGRRQHNCRSSTCCATTSGLRARMMNERAVRRSLEESWRSTEVWKTRSRTCFLCLGSSRVRTRSRRWTGRFAGGVR
jgi:hypothetical protein